VTVILITGKNGQVGRELVRCLQPLGRVIATGRAELDLANPDSIRRTVRGYAPQIVVNAAAYTAVDKAESEPEVARQVNAIGPGVLAEEAKRVNALFLHYSTDYIFDGVLVRPYAEDDAPNPLNIYGMSKLEGERAITAAGGAFLILRTSWIYSDQPPNFVLTILKLAREKREIAVVDDQVGSPTWARSLADATAKLLGKEARARDRAGIYHLSALGHVSRYGCAKRILELIGTLSPGRYPRPALRPIPTADYPLPAARPLNCPMSKDKVKAVFGVEMTHWNAQLEACLQELLREPASAVPQSGKV
jgi:dTDP-4-dehydrorhamnose reductase